MTDRNVEALDDIVRKQGIRVPREDHQSFIRHRVSLRLQPRRLSCKKHSRKTIAADCPVRRSDPVLSSQPAAFASTM
jgi:hypothetical protein